MRNVVLLLVGSVTLSHSLPSQRSEDSWQMRSSVGQCTDAADTAVWTKHKSTFQDDMTSCGKQCMGTSACVSSCIQKKNGYSTGCSGCFGALAQCTKDHCMLQCLGGNTPACADCVKKAECDTDFTTCSGVTPPQSWGHTLGATPSGTYSGEKKVLGEDVQVVITVDDSTHMDLSITGPATINCKKEQYALSGSTVTVPGASQPGDCIHDALGKIPGGGKLDSVSYDSSADTITVKINVAILPLTIQLKKGGNVMQVVPLVEKQVRTAGSSLAVTWSDCGSSEGAHVKVTDVEPKNIVLGKTTTITGTGILDEDIPGATFSMETKAAGITVLSCSGDASQKKVCKIPLAGSMSFNGVTFPIKKGSISGIPQVGVSLSSLLPSKLATTTTTVKATAANGDLVFCVTVNTAPAESQSERLHRLAYGWDM